MKGKKLFVERWKEEKRYQKEVMSGVVDLVTFLYIIGPLLFIIPYIYIELWRMPSLYWSENLPITLLLLLLAAAGGGSFRFYVKEADKLFLLQLNGVIAEMKRHGGLVTFGFIMLKSFLLTVAALPILYNFYGYSIGDAGLIVGWLSFYGWLVAMAKLTVTGKWRLKFVHAFLILLFMGNVQFFMEPGIFLVEGAVVLVVIWLFFKHSILRTGNLDVEIEEERRARQRYLGLIFQASMETETPVGPGGKRPFFYRKSGRMFTSEASSSYLLEGLFKAFLRRKEWVGYFQILGLSMLGVLLLPLWAKFLVLLTGLLFLHSWLRYIFEQLLTSLFFFVVTFRKEDESLVWKKFRNTLFGIAALLLCLEIGVLILGV
ncbi:ABC transporter permease [Salimicrobium flavidum]|uniref:ABC transporter protein EcsB n=1 Tax=Salimicrobium flavidum TaxID=570947 RepID=A0A1N7INQ9_9BACI|nr:ABC transporter permease [Salimicrobium flavidum]SIS38636.1 ABC transporter protein EcsB [Salimicrobium flavidum]